MIYYFFGVGSPWFIVSVGSVHRDLLFMWGRLTVIYYFCGVGSARRFVISVGRLTVIYIIYVGSAHRDLLFKVVCHAPGFG